MQQPPSDADRQFVTEVRAQLQRDTIITDPAVLESYRRDNAVFPPAGMPACVVVPRSTQEVAAAVLVASRHGRPVVTRGAGSGLTGGANAIDGGIVISLAAMDQIVDLDAANQVVTVQAGAITGRVKSAAAEHGLRYPPDPASADFSTIGGNIATNAGGLCCVRYGVTSDYVLGLEVVLADGTVTRVGRRTVKGVAGYDLTRLLVGSEGTLGIITEATLRLIPQARTRRTIVAGFSAAAQSAAAVLGISSKGAWPTLIEVMDRATIQAVNEWKGLDIPAVAALLLIQTEGTAEAAQAEAADVQTACEEAGAQFTYVASDEDESEQLLDARRLAYPALERLGRTLLDDVAVPRSRVPELLARIDEISRVHGVQIGTFGHAGEGNLHPTIVHSESSAHRAEEAFNAIIAAALDLDGTVAGEHGIGQLKLAHLRDELPDEVRALQTRIKAAFDPQGTLNPGRAISPT